LTRIGLKVEYGGQEADMKIIARSSNLLGKITILVMVGLCVNTAVALDGSGTQEDPWRIKSLDDFNDFAADANYWDDYTRMETDVNLAGMVYSRAVIAWDVNDDESGWQGAFTGVFDGNDHKIFNMTINGGSNNIMGLFGYIAAGEVKNLGLEGGSISVSRSFIGGLVGCSWGGFISNCYSTGSVNGAGWVGGLVGTVEGNEGNISNCYSTGDVNGVLQVGGLVGHSMGGFISNCYSTGSVSCDYYGVGGLIGITEYYSTISNCYSTGNVNGVDEVGGLIGSNGGIISNCYSTGDVNGVEVVGGLVGWNEWDISNCYVISSVHGEYAVGGLVGTNSRNISACYSTGNVNGFGSIGGLVGSIIDDTYSIVTKCYSTSDVSGKYWLGGLVGNNSDGIISDCYSTGNISGNDGIGGLIGYNTAFVVTNCYSKGSVDGNDFVGGLVGNNAGVLTATYWDIETSGESNMCGEDVYGYGCDNSYGKTTAEMMRQSTYPDYWIHPWGQEGKWDFINVWNIGENQTYPYLRTYLPSDINKDGIVNFLDVAITANQWMEGVE
jgi:hypothetical protein